MADGITASKGNEWCAALTKAIHKRVETDLNGKIWVGCFIDSAVKVLVNTILYDITRGYTRVITLRNEA